MDGQWTAGSVDGCPTVIGGRGGIKNGKLIQSLYVRKCCFSERKRVNFYNILFTHLVFRQLLPTVIMFLYH